MKYITLQNGLLTEVNSNLPNNLVALNNEGYIDRQFFDNLTFNQVLNLTTEESLSTGDFVNIYLATGDILKTRLADSNDKTKLASGFVLSDVEVNGTATIYLNGIYTTTETLTIGKPYYLSGHRPALYSSAISYLQYLGVALDKNTLLVNIGNGIRRV